jgi:sugar lactone lactonase YvrE
LASFNNSNGIAADNSGNVYVADSGNSLVRKITPSGQVSTIAGTDESLSYPFGVAVDSAGNVYVTDMGHDLIKKITPAGVITTIAGSDTFGSTDGTGSNATFDNPAGIAIDKAGNLYVTDEATRLIRKVTGAGVVTTIAGRGNHGFTPANGPVTTADLGLPIGITVDRGGNIYFADYPDNMIRKIASP